MPLSPSQVYRNGKHVKKYEDKDAEFDGRSVDISTSPIRVRGEGEGRQE